MFVDTRSPHQKAKDSIRCPACGYRPQDEVDELIKSMTGSSTTYTQATCDACDGSGFDGDVLSACPACDGAGTRARSQ